MEMDKDFNLEEQKIYRAIFSQEDNEYSAKIERLNHLYSKLDFPRATIPAFVPNKSKSLLRIIAWVSAPLALAAGLFILLLLRREHVPAEMQAFSGFITVSLGDVKVIRNGEKLDATSGMEIREGFNIITGEKSYVDLTLSDTLQIRIRENSVFTLKNIQKNDSQSRLSGLLTAGSSIFRISKMKKSDTISVETPTLVAGVRGTVFLIKVLNAKETTVSVVEGTVNILDFQKKDEFLVKAGESYLDSERRIQPLSDLDKDLFSNFLINKPEYHQGSVKQNSLTIDPDSIEEIKLIDKTIIRGQIIKINESELIIKTIDGIRKIERSRVLEIEQKK